MLIAMNATSLMLMMMKMMIMMIHSRWMLISLWWMMLLMAIYSASCSCCWFILHLYNGSWFTLWEYAAFFIVTTTQLLWCSCFELLSTIQFKVSETCNFINYIFLSTMLVLLLWCSSLIVSFFNYLLRKFLLLKAHLVNLNGEVRSSVMMMKSASAPWRRVTSTIGSILSAMSLDFPTNECIFYF